MTSTWSDRPAALDRAHAEELEAVLAAFTVERSNPVPLYFQISRHLEQAIQTGALPPGTLFVNEIDLADRIGVSRPTMRRAMEALVDQGLVVRRRGVGTRVVQPQVRRPLELTSLYDDLVASGQQPSTEVLERGVVAASAEVAEALAVAEGSDVARLVRVRSVREQPIAVLTNHLPHDVIDLDDPALESSGLYGLLRRNGVRLHTATQRVGAKVASAAEARLLDERRGAALLTMQRVALDDTGRAVEFGTHLYSAARYAFETHLVEP